MAAPNVASRSQGAGSTGVVTMPSGITAGDLLLMFVSSHGLTVPSGWTQLARLEPASGIVCWALGRIATGSEGTITLAGAWEVAWGVYRYAADRPFDLDDSVHFGSAVWQTNPNPPALTLATSKERSWGVIAWNQNTWPDNITAFPSGYGNDSIAQQSPDMSWRSKLYVGTHDAEASSQDPGAFSTDYGIYQYGAVTWAVEYGPGFQPDPIGIEVGFLPGLSLVLPEEVTVYQSPPLGIEVGFIPGIRFRTYGKRQVMLTGSGIETPEMTAPGSPGQLLSVDGEWVDPPAGAAALDDLTDVDAAAPGDGQALVWSDAESAWVAGDVAASGGVEGFWQDAEPTATQDASLWYDTDDDSPPQGGSSSGTSFPASPTTYMRFYRTDIRGGMWFRYNGTRWLSEQLFNTQFGFSDITSANITNPLKYVAAGVPPDYDIYVTAITVTTYVGTTNNGSHYWTVTVDGYKLGNSNQNLYTQATSADSASTLTRHDNLAVNTVCVTSGGTGVFALRAMVGYTGSPGNLYCYGSVFYRLIAT